MKYFIVSDIHGSAYYCRKAIEAAGREQADRILLLGDILYHGPRNDLPRDYDPKAAAKMLNDIRQDLFCVRGNCEAEVDQMVLDFPVMADYALIDAGKRMIFMTHGHIFNTDHVPPHRRGDILLHGHTHVPACEVREDYVYMNPGSVSLPKEGTPRGYMTFDGREFLWKTVDGEVYMNYIPGDDAE